MDIVDTALVDSFCDIDVKHWSDFDVKVRLVKRYGVTIFDYILTIQLASDFALGADQFDCLEIWHGQLTHTSTLASALSIRNGYGMLLGYEKVIDAGWERGGHSE